MSTELVTALKAALDFVAPFVDKPCSATETLCVSCTAYNLLAQIDAALERRATFREPSEGTR